MVADFITCFGPDKNDARLYYGNAATQLPTGVSFPTTTADGAGPPQGDRWLKVTDAATGRDITTPRTITAKTYGWLVQRGARVRGTLGAGESSQYLRVRVANDTLFVIIWVRVSDSTFNWRLAHGTGTPTVLATGSTAYNTDTTYSLRLQLDGTSATLWVDGVQEVKGAYTNRLDKSGIDVRVPPSTGQEHYYSRLLLCQSDTETDRPDTDVEIGTLVEDGDWATEQDYGDDADCASTDAVAADVALDGSDAVDTSIYWCEEGGAAGNQMVELTTFTFTIGKDILGLTERATARANVSSKTVAVEGRIHDGTDVREESFANLPGTTFIYTVANHLLAPDGGSWTQSDVDGLKGGVSSNSSNGANDEWAAIIFEACAVSNDPPPAAGVDRRRLMGQVV